MDVEVARSDISCWGILDPSFGNTIVKIYSNWSGGGTLTFCVGIRDLLTA